MSYKTDISVNDCEADFTLIICQEGKDASCIRIQDNKEGKNVQEIYFFNDSLMELFKLWELQVNLNKK